MKRDRVTLGDASATSPSVDRARLDAKPVRDTLRLVKVDGPHEQLESIILLLLRQVLRASAHARRRQDVKGWTQSEQ